MGRHVVVGAGPVGLATVRELVAQGHGDVLLVSRSGRGDDVPGVRRVALDVADAEALTTLAEGAGALHNCVNPPSYDVWSTWWPPVARAFLVAAERTGAVLVTASCLYPYGPTDAPMTEGQADRAAGVKGALRATMWADARAAHEAGRLRAVEVRGSDYAGPGVTTAHLPTVAPRALAGRSVRVFGRADVAHSFTDVRDMARTLVAVAGRPDTHGRVWHAPTNPPRTQAEAVADVCRAVGREPVRVRPWPRALLGVGGLVVPLLREMRETVHQFERPYVLDSSLTQRELGLAPTPWDDVCRATAETALGGVVPGTEVSRPA
ncbi:NAD-dependent epimerase/dehydratase family protein [Nocardioides dongxiaopingii]|uniref:NAD-dependent epimerase/dehydratase family protein n=1 Tax=Nocardioides TaxID=1839 RepID=UPI0010C76563|nr:MULTISPECIES: NAD-dependent epimerase/dehydratase family protein [Nocardioides]QCW50487.1 NAD-dependent epimerase/dehydratase family protein [Nocardioides sp. S-1144]